MHKLYRSTNDVVISGVCAGFAQRYGLDVTLVRVLYGLFTIVSFGSGFALYVASALIIPKAPDDYEPHRQATTSLFSEVSHVWFGLALVIFGASLLFKKLFVWLDANFFMSLLLIFLGVYLIINKRWGRSDE